MKLKQLGMWVLCLLVMVLAGCQSDKSDGKRFSSLTNNPCKLDVLIPGDMVILSFQDLPPPGIPDQKVRVKEDGTLTLPMSQTVLAGGKTIAVVEKEIVALYVPKFYRQLSVTIKGEDRFFFVGGEVKMPNRQPYIGPTTVTRAIQSCGDFTDFAKRTKVELRRANGAVVIVNCKKAGQDPRLDLPVCPGDSIHVPRRIW